jgi:Hpt domain
MGRFTAHSGGCCNGECILTRLPPTPIDRSKLDGQTFGDAAIRRDVLMMLKAELPVLLQALAATAGAARSDVAHRLKGSALALGADGLADAAAALEATSDDIALFTKVEAAAADVLADVEVLLAL